MTAAAIRTLNAAAAPVDTTSTPAALDIASAAAANSTGAAAGVDTTNNRATSSIIGTDAADSVTAAAVPILDTAAVERVDTAAVDCKSTAHTSATRNVDEPQQLQQSQQQQQLLQLQLQSLSDFSRSVGISEFVLSDDPYACDVTATPAGEAEGETRAGEATGPPATEATTVAAEAMYAAAAAATASREAAGAAAERETAAAAAEKAAAGGAATGKAGSERAAAATAQGDATAAGAARDGGEALAAAAATAHREVLPAAAADREPTAAAPVTKQTEDERFASPAAAAPGKGGGQGRAVQGLAAAATVTAAEVAATENRRVALADAQTNTRITSLKGSLKLLYEDFQVYEHSYFPCMCKAEGRICGMCGTTGFDCSSIHNASNHTSNHTSKKSSNRDGDNSSSNTSSNSGSNSDAKANSGSNNSSSSSSSSSGRGSSQECTRGDESWRRVETYEAGEEETEKEDRKKRASTNRAVPISDCTEAAAGSCRNGRTRFPEAVAEMKTRVCTQPCAYGCWCKAFGNEKPLRLPFLILPSDVQQQKQQQHLDECGATIISPAFSLLHCYCSRKPPVIISIPYSLGFCIRSSNSESSCSSGSSRNGRGTRIRGSSDGSSTNRSKCTCSTSKGVNNGNSRGTSSSSRGDTSFPEGSRTGRRSSTISNNSSNSDSGKTSDGECSSGSGIYEATIHKSSINGGTRSDPLDAGSNSSSGTLGMTSSSNCSSTLGTNGICSSDALNKSSGSCSSNSSSSSSSSTVVCPLSLSEVHNIEAYIRYLSVASALYRGHFLSREKKKRLQQQREGTAEEEDKYQQHQQQQQQRRKQQQQHEEQQEQQHEEQEEQPQQQQQQRQPQQQQQQLQHQQQRQQQQRQHRQQQQRPHEQQQQRPHEQQQQRRREGQQQRLQPQQQQRRQQQAECRTHEEKPNTVLKQEGDVGLQDRGKCGKSYVLYKGNIHGSTSSSSSSEYNRQVSNDNDTRIRSTSECNSGGYISHRKDHTSNSTTIRDNKGFNSSSSSSRNGSICSSESYNNSNPLITDNTGYNSRNSSIRNDVGFDSPISGSIYNHKASNSSSSSNACSNERHNNDSRSVTHRDKDYSSGSSSIYGSGEHNGSSSSIHDRKDYTSSSVSSTSSSSGTSNTVRDKNDNVGCVVMYIQGTTLRYNMPIYKREINLGKKTECWRNCRQLPTADMITYSYLLLLRLLHWGAAAKAVAAAASRTAVEAAGAAVAAEKAAAAAAAVAAEGVGCAALATADAWAVPSSSSSSSFSSSPSLSSSSCPSCCSSNSSSLCKRHREGGISTEAEDRAEVVGACRNEKSRKVGSGNPLFEGEKNEGCASDNDATAVAAAAATYKTPQPIQQQRQERHLSVQEQVRRHVEQQQHRKIGKPLYSSTHGSHGSHRSCNDGNSSRGTNCMNIKDSADSSSADNADSSSNSNYNGKNNKCNSSTIRCDTINDSSSDSSSSNRRTSDRRSRPNNNDTSSSSSTTSSENSSSNSNGSSSYGSSSRSDSHSSSSGRIDGSTDNSSNDNGRSSQRRGSSSTRSRTSDNRGMQYEEAACSWNREISETAGQRKEQQKIKVEGELIEDVWLEEEEEKKRNIKICRSSTLWLLGDWASYIYRRMRQAADITFAAPAGTIKSIAPGAPRAAAGAAPAAAAAASASACNELEGDGNPRSDAIAVTEKRIATAASDRAAAGDCAAAVDAAAGPAWDVIAKEDGRVLAAAAVASVKSVPPAAAAAAAAPAASAAPACNPLAEKSAERDTTYTRDSSKTFTYETGAVDTAASCATTGSNVAATAAVVAGWKESFVDASAVASADAASLSSSSPFFSAAKTSANFSSAAVAAWRLLYEARAFSFPVTATSAAVAPVPSPAAAASSSARPAGAAAPSTAASAAFTAAAATDGAPSAAAPALSAGAAAPDAASRPPGAGLSPAAIAASMPGAAVAAPSAAATAACAAAAAAAAACVNGEAPGLMQMQKAVRKAVYQFVHTHLPFFDARTLPLSLLLQEEKERAEAKLEQQISKRQQRCNKEAEVQGDGEGKENGSSSGRSTRKIPKTGRQVDADGDADDDGQQQRYQKDVEEKEEEVDEEAEKAAAEDGRWKGCRHPTSSGKRRPLDGSRQQQQQPKHRKNAEETEQAKGREKKERSSSSSRRTSFPDKEGQQQQQQQNGDGKWEEEDEEKGETPRQLRLNQTQGDVAALATAGVQIDEEKECIQQGTSGGQTAFANLRSMRTCIVNQEEIEREKRWGLLRMCLPPGTVQPLILELQGAAAAAGLTAAAAAAATAAAAPRLATGLTKARTTAAFAGPAETAAELGGTAGDPEEAPSSVKSSATPGVAIVCVAGESASLAGRAEARGAPAAAAGDTGAGYGRGTCSCGCSHIEISSGNCNTERLMNGTEASFAAAQQQTMPVGQMNDGETKDIVEEEEEEKKQQLLFTDCFVSVAACIAQQSELLQHLLYALQKQQQELRLSLLAHHVRERSGSGDGQRQQQQQQQRNEADGEERDDGKSHATQMKKQNRKTSREEKELLERQWTNCEGWVSLVAAALAALTDEKEQQRLLLIRITPVPACLSYLFPPTTTLLQLHQHTIRKHTKKQPHQQQQQRQHTLDNQTDKDMMLQQRQQEQQQEQRFLHFQEADASTDRLGTATPACARAACVGAGAGVAGGDAAAAADATNAAVSVAGAGAAATAVAACLASSLTYNSLPHEGVPVKQKARLGPFPMDTPFLLPRQTEGFSSATPFLHFVLLKVNRDTAAAVRLLEDHLRRQRLMQRDGGSSSSNPCAMRPYGGRSNRRLTGGASSVIVAAGTKDRRAITVQRCSAYKVTPESLLEACYLGQQQHQQRSLLQRRRQVLLQPLQGGRQDQMTVADISEEEVINFSDFSGDEQQQRQLRGCPQVQQLPPIFVAPLGYYAEPQWLGNLKGNFFQVLIRNLRPGGRAEGTAATPIVGCSREALAAAALAAARDAAAHTQASGKCRMCSDRPTATAASTETVAPLSPQPTCGRVSTRESSSDFSQYKGDKSTEVRSAAAGTGAADTADAMCGAKEQSPVSTTSLPTDNRSCPGQAADRSEDFGSVSLGVPTTQRSQDSKKKEPSPVGTAVHSSVFFVPLSECEKEVQQLGEAVGRSMESFCSTGFLNYYGLQRFGTHAVRTYEVGAALLREDWVAAAAGILGQRPMFVSDTTQPLSKSSAGRGEEGGRCAIRGREGVATDAAEKAAAASECVALQNVRSGGATPKRGHCLRTTSSPWSVLQHAGPAAALKSLASHQHIERIILSSLLQYCPRQKKKRPSAHMENCGREPLSYTKPAVNPLRLHSHVPASSSSEYTSLRSSHLCTNVSLPPSCPRAATAARLCYVSSAGAPSPGSSSAIFSPLQQTAVLPRVSPECLTDQQRGPTRALEKAQAHSLAVDYNAMNSQIVQQRTSEKDEKSPRHLPGQEAEEAQEHRQPGSGTDSSLYSYKKRCSKELAFISDAPWKYTEEAGCGSWGGTTDLTVPAENKTSLTASGGTAAVSIAERKEGARGKGADAALSVAERGEGTGGEGRDVAAPMSAVAAQSFSIQEFSQLRSWPSAVYFRALCEVAPTSLQLYLHAAQSVLFNFACSWRWRKYGPRVRVGDFVCCSTVSGEGVLQPLRTIHPISSNDKVCPRTSNSSDIPKLAARTTDVAAGGLQAKRLPPSSVNTETYRLGISGDNEEQPFVQSDPLINGAAHGSLAFVRADGGSDEEGRTGQGASLHMHYSGRPVRRICSEAEARMASIHDVVLPLAGTDVELPADLLETYRRLSRDVLGVEFEQFRKFSAAARHRYVSRSRRRRAHPRKQASSSAFEENLCTSQDSCDGKPRRGGERRHPRASRNLNRGARETMGRSRRKRTERTASIEGQHVGGMEAEDQGALRTSGMSERRAEGRDRRGGEDGDSVCATRPAQRNSLADDDEHVEVAELGIACQGGFRPLLVHPRCCSWQLLRVGDDPDGDREPLLLSDVDLLLRDRYRAAQKGADAKGDLSSEETVQPSHRLVIPQELALVRRHVQAESVQEQRAYASAGWGDFRVSVDEELLCNSVRCIPGVEKGRKEHVSSAHTYRYSKVAGGLAGNAEPHSKAESLRTRRGSSVNDGAGPRPRESSFEEEATEHKMLRPAPHAHHRKPDLIVRGEKSNFCLLLRFWLPAGCYFTMALREILRANAPDEDNAAFAGARLQYCPTE